MGKPNSKQVIAERREKIMDYMSKGYSQGAICKELGVTRQTISSDMRWVNQSMQKGLFGLAKGTLSTGFFSCIEGANAAKKNAGTSTIMLTMIQRLTCGIK
jgi:transposase-like protein